MAHATQTTPPVVIPAPSRARALVGTVARVAYPYLLGGGVGYLALTVVSRDIALMFTGALLVLYGSALSKALQRQGPSDARERGTDGAQ